jgi:hypothetical protein
MGFISTQSQDFTFFYFLLLILLKTLFLFLHEKGADFQTVLENNSIKQLTTQNGFNNFNTLKMIRQIGINFVETVLIPNYFKDALIKKADLNVFKEADTLVVKHNDLKKNIIF